MGFPVPGLAHTGSGKPWTFKARLEGEQAQAVISGGESSRGEGRGSIGSRPPSLFGVIFDKKRHQKIYQKIGVPKSGPGGAQGRPGEPQGEPRGPNGSQKAPKRLPKELPKSMILGFG